MKIFEIRKRAYSRDVFVFGRRIASFMRKKAVCDAMLRYLMWQADYRVLRQHGIELPGESAYYWTGHYEVLQVRLGDLRRYWDEKVVPLDETDLGRFLAGHDAEGLRRYYEKLMKITTRSDDSVTEAVEDSKRLFANLEKCDYDPSVCCITIDMKNVILDGFHRSAFLFARNGPDYKVKVVRVLPNLR